MNPPSAPPEAGSLPPGGNGASAGGRCRLPIAVDHPAFAGHFPGRPIVPGVVLLDETVRALDAALGGEGLWTLGSAKFLSPVEPGEAVELRWQGPGPTGAIAFSLVCGERPVASGALTPQPGRR